MNKHNCFLYHLPFHVTGVKGQTKTIIDVHVSILLSLVSAQNIANIEYKCNHTLCMCLVCFQEH